MAGGLAEGGANKAGKGSCDEESTEPHVPRKGRVPHLSSLLSEDPFPPSCL